MQVSALGCSEGAGVLGEVRPGRVFYEDRTSLTWQRAPVRHQPVKILLTPVWASTWWRLVGRQCDSMSNAL